MALPLLVTKLHLPPRPVASLTLDDGYIGRLEELGLELLSVEQMTHP